MEKKVEEEEKIVVPVDSNTCMFYVYVLVM